MLSLGIIGLPNVGKSTLFNALTKNNVLAANYPFATIDPNIGIVAVPDSRLDKLAAIFKPQKVTPATVTFVDIAGLVAGAHKGEGLGNQFLAHIRETNALAHVVRAFEDPDVTHIESVINPSADIETIKTELILADLQTIDKILERLSRQSKGNSKLKPEIETLRTIRERLNENELIDEEQIYSSNLEPSPELKTIVAGLLSIKPVIYVFNVSEATLDDEHSQQQLKKLVDPAPAIFVSAQLESTLREMNESDQQELLASVGQAESGLHQLIHLGYRALGLQSFFTAGDKEVRAWTINAGAKAPQAAGVIHTDFERGFIAAEVVNFDDLLKYGSKQAAKAAGKVRTEGKDYIMQPDDVVEFRFNV